MSRKYNIKPKPTLLHGIVYRSRTEAEWAKFFIFMEINFVYEPKLFRLPKGGKYLPDFYLPDLSFGYGSSPQGLWIEVKPTAPTREEILKLAEVSKQTKKPCAFLVGQPIQRISKRDWDLIGWQTQESLYINFADCKEEVSAGFGVITDNYFYYQDPSKCERPKPYFTYYSDKKVEEIVGVESTPLNLSPLDYYEDPFELLLKGETHVKIPNA